MATASGISRLTLSLGAAIFATFPAFADKGGAAGGELQNPSAEIRQKSTSGSGNLLAMEVSTSQACYGPGNTVCYTLSMQDLQGPVTGFQAFLEYDITQLTFDPGASSYTASPFGLHVLPMASAEVSPGSLNLSGAVDFTIPQPPTTSDAVLATLCFTVLPGNDGETANVLLRVEPPFVTTLSLHGKPVPTTFVPSAGALLDET
jgi:hypothetical protein